VTQTPFVKSFEIYVQVGAILAVLTLYFRTLINNKKLLMLLFSAFIPTAIVGFTLYRFIKSFLLGNSYITIIMLFFGGVIFIIFEKKKDLIKRKTELSKLSYKQSFFIGLVQSVSVIPGVSRAAATIIGGLVVGLNREDAVEFSFLLALPTVFAASALDLVESGFSFTSGELIVLAVGFTGAFITALLTVKFFISYIKKHTFIPFGIYRIFLAVIFWIYLSLR